MKKMLWSLLVFTLILELSWLSGFCSTDEKTPANKLEGCLCRIDQVSKTIDIVPARKQDGIDSSVTQSFVYDEKTKYRLEVEGNVVFKSDVTGKETEIQIEDKKVADLGGLTAHYVTVSYFEDKGKRIASEVTLIIRPLLPDNSYAAILGSDGSIGLFKVTTKCFCGPEK